MLLSMLALIFIIRTVPGRTLEETGLHVVRVRLVLSVQIFFSPILCAINILEKSDTMI